MQTAICFHLLCLLSTSVAELTVRCHGKESVDSLCCTPCGKGYGMVTKCYNDTATGIFHDTSCTPCDGKGQMRTFSAVVSALHNCEKCRPCDQPSETLVSECTANQDTVCLCADGYHQMPSGACEPCATCPPGEGLSNLTSCSGVPEQDCSPCPRGTYSTLYRPGQSVRVCRPCQSACPAGYRPLAGSCRQESGPICRSDASGRLHNITELQQPSDGRQQQQQQRLSETAADERTEIFRDQQVQNRPLSDWKELIDNGNPRPAINLARLNQSQLASTEEPISRHPASHNDMIPVYCAVLGAVIVSLIVWIVFKYFRRRVQHDRKTQQHQQHQQFSGSSALIPPQSPVYPPPGSCQPAALLKRRSIDSGFGGSDALAASVSSSTRPLKEISDSRFQRLENILSNSPDPAAWKELAAELGYLPEEVREFESRADSLRQSPIRLMLRDWSQRPGATIGVLGRCLQKAGRKDALILFKELADRQAGARHRTQQQQQQQQQQRKPLLDESSLQEMCQV